MVDGPRGLPGPIHHLVQQLVVVVPKRKVNLGLAQILLLQTEAHLA